MEYMNGYGAHPNQAQKPIDQSAYVGQMPAVHSPIVPISGVPQPNLYMTLLDPVFLQHISRHQGQQIALMTTAGRLQGQLAGVGADHVQLNLEDRSLPYSNPAYRLFRRAFGLLPLNVDR